MVKKAESLLRKGKTPLETYNIIAEDFLMIKLKHDVLDAMKAECWDAVIQARNTVLGRPEPVQRYKRSKCR